MWLTSLVRGLGASFTQHADFMGTVIMRVGVVFVNIYQLCSEYSRMLIVPKYSKNMLWTVHEIVYLYLYCIGLNF